MYAELGRRMHERMLKIGFREEELDRYSHMLPFIAAIDSRSEAFDWHSSKAKTRRGVADTPY